MIHRVALDIDAIGLHFFQLFHIDKATFTESTCNHEQGGFHIIFLKNRKGMLIIVNISIIKGNQHRFVRQIFAMCHVVIQLIHGNCRIPFVMKVLHLFSELLRRHHQGMTYARINAVIVQHRHTHRFII